MMVLSRSKKAAALVITNDNRQTRPGQAVLGRSGGYGSAVPPVGLTRLHSVAVQVHDVDIWSSAVQKRAWLHPPGAKRPDGPRSPPGGGRPMSALSTGHGPVAVIHSWLPPPLAGWLWHRPSPRAIHACDSCLRFREEVAPCPRVQQQPHPRVHSS